MLLVQDDTGYSNGCSLISALNGVGEERCRKDPAGFLAERSKGLIALSGGYNGELSSHLLAPWFLVVKEPIDIARKAGIGVGPGRGSPPGSLLAYCLSITDIDPLLYGLLPFQFYAAAGCVMAGEKLGALVPLFRDRNTQAQVVQCPLDDELVHHLEGEEPLSRQGLIALLKTERGLSSATSAYHWLNRIQDDLGIIIERSRKGYRITDRAGSRRILSLVMDAALDRE